MRLRAGVGATQGREDEEGRGKGHQGGPTEVEEILELFGTAKAMDDDPDLKEDERGMEYEDS
jgi:hypothetical protein